MSLPSTTFWYNRDTAAIAAVQSLAGAGSLLLNGNLATPIPNQTIITNPLDLQQNVRNVTLTSANNLSAVNFTITGMSGGVPAVEVIAGPNANTVTTVEFFSSITSITTSGAVNAVSAGVNLGFTSLYPFNYNVTNPFFALQTFVSNGPTYTAYASLYPLDSIPASEWVAFSTPLAGMTGVAVNAFVSFNTVVKYIFIDVTVAAANANLTSILLQSGIR